ncbi:hypothetical protein MKP08_05960 [Erythrobacter sp. LQ02-29]|uniref:hypothetical protein n=1 Tax=Erythrobacter sp. LQ02-29 TaxID=2920384 RepID=UPI001F4E49FB|nr:hypothetical protein [Erythrobacter sp. LQ02-29]MCP9222290.1 hypothetical protein [Erythrobacter sp. LQ02-29]
MSLGRLFRYDVRIAANATRAILTRWRDALTIVVAAAVGFAILRGWIGSRPPQVAFRIAAASAALAGLLVGSTIARRLAFHAFDGPMPSRALMRGDALRYTLGWHAIAAFVALAVALVIRSVLIGGALMGYGAGAAGAYALAALTPFGPAYRTGNLRRWVLNEAGRPRFGMICAALLTVAMLAASRLVSNDTVAGIAICGSIVCMLPMTAVDAELVRFRTIVGHGSGAIVADRCTAIAWFAGIAVPACLALVEPVAAGIVAAICGGFALVATIRIMAYRLYRRKQADLLVSVMLGVLAISALSVPPLSPALAAAMLWYLHRRARQACWLLT